MKKDTLRRADLLFSIVLILVSIWFGVKSVLLFPNPFSKDWDRLTSEEIQANLDAWFKSPGLIPLIFSVFLLICSIVLLVTAVKQGARFDFFTKEKITTFLKNNELHTALIVIGLLFGYIYILIPLCRNYLNLFSQYQWFPFLIATFTYLAVFIIIFNEKTRKKIITSFIVAAAGSGFITLSFGVAAKILLPLEVHYGFSTFI